VWPLISMPEDVRVPSTAGVQLGVTDCSGEGPPLLFLAANGFHGRCYAPMVRTKRGSEGGWGGHILASQSGALHVLHRIGMHKY